MKFLARLIACLAALLLAGGAAYAQDVQPVPALSARVIDATRTLSDAQRSALESKLAAVEHDTGSQLVVLMVATTQPEDIAAYAQRVADQWKIGRREIGDGIVIVVAKSDRRMRIEIAKGLEGAVPDLAASEIIDGAMKPAFRKDDYAGGLNAAVDQLATRIKHEALPAPAARNASSHSSSGVFGLQWMEEIGLFLFIGVPIVGGVLTATLGRKLGALATGGAAAGLGWWLGANLLVMVLVAVLAVILVGVMGVGVASRRAGARSYGGGPIIWGGGGGSGWSGGGSSSGGGFSSGGGGDFGGGGASGDW